MRNIVVVIAVVGLCLACGGLVDVPPDQPARVDVVESGAPPRDPAPLPPPPPPAALAVADRDVAPAPCPDAAHHAVVCAAVKAGDHGKLTEVWNTGANLDCRCEVAFSKRKLGSYIPIVKDTMRNQYKHWTKLQTPVFLAAGDRDPGTLKWLLEHGADPNAPSERSSGTGDAVPLDEALGRKAVLHLLLSAGADATSVNLSASRDIDEIELLVERGASAKTIDATFALDDARTIDRILALKPDLARIDGASVVRLGDLDTTKKLLDAGLPVDHPGFQDKSLLTEFAEADDLAHVEELLRRGADVNHGKSTFEVRPLDEAVDNASLPVVAALLKAGADPNRHGRLSEAPLQEAIDRGDAGIVEAIVAAGGKIKGKDAVAYAREKNASPEVLAALGSAGTGQ